MIAWLDAGHACTDLDHDAAAFVAEHRRKHTLRIIAAERECVGVADASGHDADQHFARAWWRDIDLDHLQRLARGKGDGGT